jgi:hypothetical protein
MRRTLELESANVMTFDGLYAECWIIDMYSNVTTVNLKNMTPGVLYSFLIRQDEIGGNSFAWPTRCHNAMQVDTTPNSVTVQNFIGGIDRQLYANMTGTWFEE